MQWGKKRTAVFMKLVGGSQAFSSIPFMFLTEETLHLVAKNI